MKTPCTDMLMSKKSAQSKLLNQDKGQRENEFENVVEHGRLVDAPRPPDTFYNGWYPVRRCSFFPEPSERACGKSTTKTMEYRDYRVVCDFCDKEKPLPSKSSLYGDEKLVNGMRSKGKSQVDNTYWRYHDAHPWMHRLKLPADVNMHPNNWFREQIDLDLKGMQLKRAEQRRERILNYKRLKERDSMKYQAALSAAQMMLKEQQKKCAFNNPIKYEIPPLPAPPSQHASLLHLSAGPRAETLPPSAAGSKAMLLKGATSAVSVGSGQVAE